GYIQFSSLFIDDFPECPPYRALGYALMPHWDDLVASCDVGHGIYVSTTGAAPNRVFNIEWRTRLVRNFECADYINFEVRLYENSPTQQVDYVYGVVPENGIAAVVGVQNEERSYRRSTAFECRAPSLSDGIDRKSTRLNSSH